MSERESAQRGLFAISVAELLRPLFLRWADDGPRSVYDRVLSDLWNGGGKPILNGPKSLDEIMRMPEAHYDDSHHRDFYVMLALGVLYESVKIVQGSVSPSDREFDTLAEHLFAELELTGVFHDFMERVRAAQAPSEKAGAEIRRIAMETAAAVDDALTAFAKQRGWPPDRLRR
jgi:hypothetical protein